MAFSAMSSYSQSGGSAIVELSNLTKFKGEQMKPIHGFWLIVITWIFQFTSRILLIMTQGRIPPELNMIFSLYPIVNLALGVTALFIAYSGHMQIRYRIVLVLIGLAMLLAAALGSLNVASAQWAGWEKPLVALGTIIESVWIFGAVTLGLAETTDIAKRFLILCLPVLRVILIFGDLQTPTNLGLLVVFIVALAALFGSYRLFAHAGLRV
jgi:hypothetical protein